MSLRILRALARGLFIVMLVSWPGAVPAGDIASLPSAIDSAVRQIPSRGSPNGEPFSGVAQPTGALLEKWNAARLELRIDIDIVAACRVSPDTCDSLAAKRLIEIVEDAQKKPGRALIGEINRAINLAVRATSDDLQYGVQDKWASPLMTFTSGRGDCEDYALAKYAALRAAGFGEDDLRFVIVRLPQMAHAVLSVRHDGRWLLLDNRRFAMLDAVHLDAAPLYVMREEATPAVSTAALNIEPYLM
jgi:predicted transglutaminase-like cysteine proteinase